MVYTFVDWPLRHLEFLEKHRSLASPVKYGISTLKKELRFLRTFLIYPAKAVIPCGWLSSVEAAFIKSTEELSSACREPSSRADLVVFEMLEKVKIYKPEIRKSYLILSEQQRQEEEATAGLESNNSPWLDRGALMNFVGSVLENLEDILEPKESSVTVLKIKFCSLKEKLSFFRNFLSIFLENDYSSSSRSQEKMMISFLDNSVHMATTSAACLFYLFWVDDEMDPKMNSKLSDLLHKKIKPRTSHDLDMYLALLRAAASLKADKVSRNHHEKGSEKDKTTDTVAKGSGVGSILPPKRTKVKQQIIQKFREYFGKSKTFIRPKALLQASTKDDKGLLKPSTEGSKDDERLLKASTEGSKDDEGLLKASMAEQASGNEKNDEVAEFVKFLLDNCLDSIINDQIDSLRKELEDLIAFLMDLPHNCWGDLFWISRDIKAAAIKAASFHHLDDLSELEAEKNQISDLLKAIYLLKARVILRRLDNPSKDGLMVPLKDELKPLVQVLEFLQTFSFDPPKKKQVEEKLVLSHAEIVSKEVKSLIYSIQETELTKVVVMKILAAGKDLPN
ncbi:hypothetical protein ACH5RR_036477 [Cinchona calisaya]|uniref:Late blight resistance protein R1A-like N-terminal domain-containing protein n=1 Tax=Cinchona calisaya TaxID=153742 RepID=A0ABD2Y4K4_9GENT